MAITEGEQAIIAQLKKIKQLLKGNYNTDQAANEQMNKPDE